METKTAAPRCRALVTGASSGIGREIARGLVAEGAEVLMPVRNRERAERAIRSIRDSVPDAALTPFDLDLADLGSVERLVITLRRRTAPIDLLVLNAGVVLLGEGVRRETVDGFELTFQSNFLGHAALTLGLLPLLRESGTRVVVQCSLAAARSRLDEPLFSPHRRFRAFRAYRQSKLALGLFGMALHRRSGEQGWGITVQLCHPGIVPGSEVAPAIRRMAPRAVERLVVARLGHSPADAARTALAAAASGAGEPRLHAPSGRWGFSGAAIEREPFASVADEREARRVWAETLALLGPRFAIESA